MSLMTLLVALDHWEIEQPRSPVDTPTTSLPSGSGASAVPPSNPPEGDVKKNENAFRYFVSKLVCISFGLPFAF